MAVLALAFASTFIVLNATGIISVERITHWLELAQQSSPILIGSIIALLLFLDLFVAMPTLTLIILSGFFLGPILGATFSIIGLISAGFCGYTISHYHGDKLARILIRDESELVKAKQSFQQFGVATILLSRAIPILPEVSACMAGLTRMPKAKFAAAWLLSTVPYALIASYAGAISSKSNLKPAIIAAIGLTTFFWLAWAAYRKLVINNSSHNQEKARKKASNERIDIIE